MDQSKKANIIIVKKKKTGGHGEHHGAWKVAFADFAIAMMAFFLVLWLKDAATIQEKKAISEYFTDPVGYLEGGSRYVVDLGGRTAENQTTPYNPKQELDSPKDSGAEYDAEAVANLAKNLEDEKFRELAQALQTRIENDEHLKKYKDQVIMGITSEGLQIQIVDKESRPMFDSGSDEIKNYAEEIIFALGEAISKLPNSMTISGHTDSAPYVGRKNYSNWELSADRANAARRILQNSGVDNVQIAQVVGYGPTKLYDNKEPDNPINRRISVVVLNRQTELEMGIEKKGAGLPKETSPMESISNGNQPEQTINSASSETEQTQNTITNTVESFRMQQQNRSRATGAELIQPSDRRGGQSTQPSQSSKTSGDDFFQNVQIPVEKQKQRGGQEQSVNSKKATESQAQPPVKEPVSEKGSAAANRPQQPAKSKPRSQENNGVKQAPSPEPAEKSWWEDQP